MRLSFLCLTLMRLLPLLALLAAPAQAGPVHFVKTHKAVLIADALTTASLAADAASSVHCQNVAPETCIETSGMLGPHPTPRSTWLHVTPFIGGFIAANHLIWHFAPDAKEQHTQAKVVLGTLTTPIVIDEFFNVRSNVRTAEALSQKGQWQNSLTPQ